MALGGVAVAFAAGGVWTALADGRYLSRVGLSMILVAGLLALVGGSLLARAARSGRWASSSSCACRWRS